VRAADINRIFSRHRRATALAGVIVVLGVVALDAHAALPEHHDQPGHATVCIAELAIATLAALGWCRKRPMVGPPTRIVGLLLRPRGAEGDAYGTTTPSARAGPPALAVLRL